MQLTAAARSTRQALQASCGVQEMHAVELELENRALKSSLREYKTRARTFRHHAASAGLPLQYAHLHL